jgi:hypothetical protein
MWPRDMAGTVALPPCYGDPVRPEGGEETGGFADITFAQLLIRALDQRWTGTLVIDPPSDMLHALDVDRGLVSRVLVPDDYAQLGTLLVESGVIMQSELDLALGEPGPLGQALIALGLLDDPTLRRALVLQNLTRLVRLFGLPLESEWIFHLERDTFDGMPDGARVDTLRVLWAGLSAHGEMGSALETTLERVGGTPFALRSDVKVDRFGFTGEVSRLVGLLQHDRMGLAELVDSGVTPPEVCRRVVYALAIARCLDFSPAGSDSVAPVAPSSSEEDEPTSSDETRVDGPQLRQVARIKLRRVALGRVRAEGSSRDSNEPPSPRLEAERSPKKDSETPPEPAPSEIAGRLTRLQHDTPFTLLGLDTAAFSGRTEAAITEMLWDAYESLARRWDPDACPSERHDLREGMQKLHDAITEAFIALSDPVTRAVLLANCEPASGAAKPSPAVDIALPSARRQASTLPGYSGAAARPPAAAADKGGTKPPASPRLRRRRDATTLPSVGAAKGLGVTTPHASPPPIGDLLPSQLHERALVAMSEQRLSEALRLCLLACDAVPDNPDYAASSVWIRARMASADLDVLLDELDALLTRSPEHIASRFYRGVLRRKVGRIAGARQDFQEVLLLDPSHAGARKQLGAIARDAH